MWPIFYIRNQVYERFWKPFPTSIGSAIATLFATFCQDPAELTLGLRLVGVHMNVYLLEQGREESVGNDDDSIVCARQYEMVRMT